MTENRKRELLQQYINGSISPKNRHMLEREALDDVFLFEALEGYSKHFKSTELPFYKSKTNPIVPIRTFLTMAASFLVLAVVAFLIKDNLNPKVSDNAISQMEAQATESEDQIAHIEDAQINENIGGTQFQVEQNNQSKSLTRTLKTKPVSVVVDNNGIENEEIEPHKKVYTQSNTTGTATTTIPGSPPVADVVPEEAEVQEELLVLEEAESPINSEINSPSYADDQSENSEYAKPKARVSIPSESPSIEKSRKSSRQNEERQESTNSLPQEAGESSVIELEESEMKDSLQRENLRKSFPIGGWAAFNEELDNFKEQLDCSDFSITFKFQILPTGEINDLTVTDMPSVSDTGSNNILLECLNKTKGFIEEYGKWETVPPNRKVRRVLKINFDLN